MRIRKWWLALIVLSLTQLVLVLVGAIVNIALPQAQRGTREPSHSAGDHGGGVAGHPAAPRHRAAPADGGGPLVVAAGLLLLSRISEDGTYLLQVLPPLVIMGIGMAFVFVPLKNVALAGVGQHDAGAASATANSAMQIGGSVALWVFTGIYAAAVAGTDGSPAALTSGCSAVFFGAAVGMLVAAAIAPVPIRRPEPATVALT